MCRKRLRIRKKSQKRCNVDFDFGTRHLPAYAVPDGKNAFEYLRELCQSGLEKRYSPVSDELQKRLDYELGVIKKYGVCGLLSYCMGLHTFCKK